MLCFGKERTHSALFAEQNGLRSVAIIVIVGELS